MKSPIYLLLFVYFLLSEALVEQSVYNRVDSGVEHDQCVGNDMFYITIVDRCGSIIEQDVLNSVIQPTHCKDDTDSYDHQSDSLPYPHHTLGMKTAQYK